uniref:Putative secreted protein n=1 Tax=Ixodes ricinus TaxID=34613 RepID=V5GFJ0_IXORI
MKVLVVVALLVVLVYRTSAADMCDVLSEDPSRVEMIYVCIEALSSPKLKYDIYDKIKNVLSVRQDIRLLRSYSLPKPAL